MADRNVIRLLLVEDNPIHTRLVRSYLDERSNGIEFELEHVDRLSECLSRLASDDFDAVLLDLNLPDSRGLDTFRETRRHCPDLPVVVLTGDEANTTAVEAMREGAADYVFKSQMSGPVVTRSLRYAVERAARCRVERLLERTQQELELAREIQQGLFPDASPSVPGLDVAGTSIPARVMGGDFFDYFSLVDNTLAIAVGDAMGHGLGAALLCAETRAALLSLGEFNNDVGKILTGANHAISARGRDTSFVTLFLGRFDPPRRSLSFSSAGHGYGAVIDEAGNVREELVSVDIPLGVEREAVYGQIELDSLREGDVVVLLTDGIWEAGAVSDDPFGRERAFDVVREYRDESARDIVETLEAVVRQHCAPWAPTDDVTAVVVKIVPPEES